MSSAPIDASVTSGGNAKSITWLPTTFVPPQLPESEDVQLGIPEIPTPMLPMIPTAADDPLGGVPLP